MAFAVYLVVLFATIVAIVKLYAFVRQICPVAVNYHFTRRCNKTCGFCFHTATTSHMEDLDKAKEGLALLKQAGMRKINFAGGEPFLYAHFLGETIDFCKTKLHLESVSIVTNGSLVTEKFLEMHGCNIDILAVSCDSFDEATNIKIGRGSGDQVQQLYKISSWCKQYGIKFKINTVVCLLNHMEDLNKHINALQPFRWKCFQVLIVKGENDSGDTRRDARKFVITDQQYQEFCARHNQQASLVEEPNHLMAKSYLILDEYMRFLDRDGRQPSKSILQIGVQKALESVYWDKDAFRKRGGVYDWSRVDKTTPTNLDW
ncbi:hypothetical protein HBI56_108380 [Parastagonospora nodorum]|uniref:Radical SAM core domain-containing protein n=2 Tax=Phaeosphaeria nodorum (strain SN15 / ATCC MYA-4574 / FGSC 10173) TaxID=321614 RepID=A0A7U2ETZ1_PHANO|nr:hypothetical protein HBH56_040930 [Parastagonospora nodorum]QRC93041.1 hypothetical protein JI435_079100 [Parastagonospora nodorum SN15]KAH3933058.1 hypothetical protein HBH54_068680 [Parastagonospora nodorum]KAH3943553.1 hypothetical protein HBH53_172850 [Parastagonospora nodorum]KAH3961792.1 hypothetical protein HBH52_228040 [Parastagonospora nodorum]